MLELIRAVVLPKTKLGAVQGQTLTVDIIVTVMVTIWREKRPVATRPA